THCAAHMPLVVERGVLVDLGHDDVRVVEMLFEPLRRDEDLLGIPVAAHALSLRLSLAFYYRTRRRRAVFRGRLELAGRTDDLPEHVEREHERGDEADARDPVVHVR